jgi:hypothetical protein
MLYKHNIGLWNSVTCAISSMIPIAVGLVDDVTREQIAARPAALRSPAFLVPRAAVLLQPGTPKIFGRSHRAGREPVRAGQRAVAERIL